MVVKSTLKDPEPSVFHVIMDPNDSSDNLKTTTQASLSFIRIQYGST